MQRFVQREMKNPSKAWTCKACSQHIAYEWQTAPCWHLCPTCLAKAEDVQPDVAARNVRTCLRCDAKFCQGCSYMDIFRAAANLHLTFDLCKACFFAESLRLTGRNGRYLIGSVPFVKKVHQLFRSNQESADREDDRHVVSWSTPSYLT